MGTYRFQSGSSPQGAKITSTDADYATARAGSGLAASNVDPQNMGQNWNGSAFLIYEAFFSFDTSSIPDDEVVTSHRVSMHTISDNSTTDFDIEVRAFDYGSSVTTADWIAGADLGNYPLVASRDTGVGDLAGTINFVEEAGAVAAVNKAGMTRLVFSSARHRLGTQPSDAEYIGTAGPYTVYLTVITEPAASSIPQIAPWSDFLTTEQTPHGLAVGDLILQVAANVSTAFPATPAGWSEIEIATAGAGSCRAGAWYRVAEAADVFAGELAGGGFDAVGGSASSFAVGVHPTAPIGDHSQQTQLATTADPVLPSITQDKANAVLAVFTVAKIASDGIRASYACASGDPASWSEIFDENTGAAEDSAGLATGLRSTQTATGSITVDYTGSNADMASLAFFLDGPPVYSIVINEDDASTDDNDVVLTVGVIGAADPDEMCFSEDEETWTDWEPWATSRAFQLSPQTAYPTQAKTVHLAVR